MNNHSLQFIDEVSEELLYLFHAEREWHRDSGLGGSTVRPRIPLSPQLERDLMHAARVLVSAWSHRGTSYNSTGLPLYTD